tara:strand:+ start:670 stop:4992 length:4323 start_codon:yes stop_codon:yes gene_type:complete
MPEIKNNFLQAKMNKDLDDRLLPNGQYRDAQNIVISRTESESVGSVQNVLGNIQVSTFGLSDRFLEIIGYYVDELNNSIYAFITNYTDSSSDNLSNFASSASSHYICSFNSETEAPKILVAGSFLNFSKMSPITGVDMIENTLFFTDNRNQPRRINVNSASSSVSIYTTEDDVSLLKYFPFQPINLTTSAVKTISLSDPGQGFNGITLPYLVQQSEMTIVNGQGELGADLELTITSVSGAPNYVITGIEITNPGYGIKPSTGNNYAVVDINVSGFFNQARVLLYIGEVSTMKNKSDAYLPPEGGTTQQSVNPNPDYDSNWPGDKDFLREKFVRFSYRFKFDDDEYSLIAPFTQAAFVPENFGYFLSETYNKSTGLTITDDSDENYAYTSTINRLLRNIINEINLIIPCPQSSTTWASAVSDLKISEIDILYKDSQDLSIKVLETIPNSNISALGISELGYKYQSRKPIRTLPDADLIRVSDKAPIRALGLSAVGNRVVFSNYYDKHTSPDTLSYNVNMVSKTNKEALEYPNHSVKQNRTYQVGIVLSDKYGRQSDVILSEIDDGVVPGLADVFKGSTIYNSYRNLTDTPLNTPIFSFSGEALQMIWRRSIPETILKPGYPGLYAPEGAISTFTFPNTGSISPYQNGSAFLVNSSGNSTCVIEISSGSSFRQNPNGPTSLIFINGQYGGGGTINSGNNTPSGTTSSNNAGSGATFNISADEGDNLTFTLINPGSGYAAGDIITITGPPSQVPVGGTNWSADITIVVSQAMLTQLFTIVVPGTGYSVNESLSVVQGSISSATSVVESVKIPNPLGFYSYKIVVKQQEQDYYNVYLPSILNAYPNNNQKELNKTAHISLFSDNINKVPKDLTDVGPEAKEFRSSVNLFGRVTNVASNVLSSGNAQFYPALSSDFVNTIATQDNLGIGASEIISLSTNTTVQDNGTIDEIALAGNIDNSKIIIGQRVTGSSSTGNNLFDNQRLDKFIRTGTNSSRIYINPGYTNSTGNIQTIKEVSLERSPFYNAENDPLIARISTIPSPNTNSVAPNIGQPVFFNNQSSNTDPSYFPINLAVYETAPVTSNLDIYYETSSSGLITELNEFIQSGDLDTPYSFSDASFTWFEGDLAFQNITNNIFPLSANGTPIIDADATFTLDSVFEVNSGVSTPVNPNFGGAGNPFIISPNGNGGFSIKTNNDRYSNQLFYGRDNLEGRQFWRFTVTSKTFYREFTGSFNGFLSNRLPEFDVGVYPSSQGFIWRDGPVYLQSNYAFYMGSLIGYGFDDQNGWANDASSTYDGTVIGNVTNGAGPIPAPSFPDVETITTRELSITNMVATYQFSSNVANQTFPTLVGGGLIQVARALTGAARDSQGNLQPGSFNPLDNSTGGLGIILMLNQQDGNGNSLPSAANVDYSNPSSIVYKLSFDLYDGGNLFRSFSNIRLEWGYPGN